MSAAVVEFFSTYSYFTFSLVAVAVFALALAAFPSERKAMGWAALIASCTAPYQYFFVPEYWDPVIMGPLKFGPADVMFLVAHGGLGWLVVPAVHRRASLRVPAFGWASLRRWLVLKAFFLACWMLLWWAGLKVMSAALIASVVFLAVLVYLRPSELKLVLAGALCFGVGYMLFVAAVFAIEPSFLREWNPDALSGIMVLGAPIEEIAWGTAFGAVWPLFMAYVFGVERVSAPESGERPPI